MKNKFKILILTLVILFGLSACGEADRVSRNVSREADSFNVTRRLAVINMRSDKPIFDLVGKFSTYNNSDNELVVTVQTDERHTRQIG